jgi:hypothetical protein
MLPVCDALLASCSDVCQFVKLLGYPSVIPYGTIEVEDATRSEPYSFAKPGGQVLVQYPSKYFCLPRKKLAHFDFLGRHNLNQTLNAATMLL